MKLWIKQERFPDQLLIVKTLAVYGEPEQISWGSLSFPTSYSLQEATKFKELTSKRSPIKRPQKIPTTKPEGNVKMQCTELQCLPLYKGGKIHKNKWTPMENK